MDTDQPNDAKMAVSTVIPNDAKMAGSTGPNKHAPTSLVVTHLPVDVTKKEVVDFFREIGPVRNCHFVRDKDWQFKGMVYVQYNKADDAARAHQTLNRKNFRGSALRIKFSRNKQREERKMKAKKKKLDRLEAMNDEHFVQEMEERQQRKKEKSKLKYEANRAAKKLRKGRIILRNLPFKVTEEIIEEHFSPYGKINEIKLVRKDGKKLAGYAFLQYETRQQALNAIRECNMKPLLGRSVVVDLAVPKSQFDSQKIKEEVSQDEIKIEEVDIKEETGDKNVFCENPPMDFDYSKVKIKSEKLSDDDDSDSGVEEESDDDDIDDNESNGNREDSDSNSDSDDDDDDDDSDSDEDDDEEEKIKKRKPGKKPESMREPSKDIAEERTLFIKNLSFDATKEDITEVLSRFGGIKYVLLCIDPLTEHARGTAFAQFKTKEAAMACLAAEADPMQKDQFVLLGRPMHIMKAVSRGTLQDQKKEESDKKGKDKRNLYLAREGFIRPGTQAAIGMSPADINLRQMRERVKRRMLQNLNIFVSKTRLCINNLPLKMGDAGLRKLILKHGEPGCQITEVRVMKNLRDIGDDGKPKSRGYGFVAFTDHEHALATLRKLNNNPDIFTIAKRPIVEFSMENREILRAREKRLEKSRENNPLLKKGKDAGNKSETRENAREKDDSGDQLSFMGSKADPSMGPQNALPSNIGAKVRTKKGKITRKLLKKQRQDKRKKGQKRLRVVDNSVEEPLVKKLKEDGASTKKKKRRNKPTVTKNLRAELHREKSFTAMVKQYKQKMSSVNSGSSKRWYED